MNVVANDAGSAAGRPYWFFEDVRPRYRLGRQNPLNFALHESQTLSFVLNTINQLRAIIRAKQIGNTTSYIVQVTARSSSKVRLSVDLVVVGNGCLGLSILPVSYSKNSTLHRTKSSSFPPSFPRVKTTSLLAKEVTKFLFHASSSQLSSSFNIIAISFARVQKTECSSICSIFRTTTIDLSTSLNIDWTVVYNCIMVKMRFDIALFSSLAVYAVSAMPVPADNGGNNAPPNPNSPNDCVRDVWAENSFGPNSEVIEVVDHDSLSPNELTHEQHLGNSQYWPSQSIQRQYLRSKCSCLRGRSDDSNFLNAQTPEQGAAFFGNAAASVPSSDSSATLGIFGSGASSSIPPNVFRGPSHAGVSSSSGKGWVIAGNRYGANARVNMGKTGCGRFRGWIMPISPFGPKSIIPYSGRELREADFGV
ncbi:hypothetical protein F5878DRAFT_645955 [Lentinula raphanica]|uniref:Uncharacterized protein n=1 Tax=Lentinula raphanica TaxID=153919 RepID=A0AA38NZB4_9AGAR|nr:hypothetical protein F5878DRAFT_645955 [Lentinula raphanica]